MSIEVSLISVVNLITCVKQDSVFMLGFWEAFLFLVWDLLVLHTDIDKTVERPLYFIKHFKKAAEAKC